MPRRLILAASAALAAATKTAASAEPDATQQGSPKSLVVLFTRSGNTRVIAGIIQRRFKAAFFEIQPAKPYPDDYEATVARARLERDQQIEPPIVQTVSDLSRYSTVFLCFPIWGETAPPVIRTFLKAHNFQGKTVRPFITHGGYGLGNSLSVIQGHAPGAQIASPFVMEADQERRTLNQVQNWLGQIKGNTL
ncbi:hypothetical protein ACELLULO517_03785 [Acidisoma cellulosilytica]|uniref:Flavodoxin-like domain-containing protein n=1 Tax=Acidisoma cellulosilyticum TaxID=2802395 RepID=A0A963YZQ3_9PROT|nr:flavodoxin [Acidisoma cellulosilyticum]MCB8879342.1 hypothetical protein [Acidisoma cellulosilyticum]